MIKRISLVARKESMSPEAFRQHWMGPHAAIVRQLKSQGFIAAQRQGWVRASPHFYISPEDVGRLVEALQ